METLKDLEDASARYMGPFAAAIQKNNGKIVPSLGFFGITSIVAASQAWQFEVARTTFLQLAYYSFFWALVTAVLSISLIALVRAAKSEWKVAAFNFASALQVIILIAAFVHLYLATKPLIACAFENAAKCGVVG